MTHAKTDTSTGDNGVDRPRRRAGGRPFGDPMHPLTPSEAGKLGAPAAAAVKRDVIDAEPVEPLDLGAGEAT